MPEIIGPFWMVRVEDTVHWSQTVLGTSALAYMDTTHDSVGVRVGVFVAGAGVFVEVGVPVSVGVSVGVRVGPPGVTVVVAVAVSVGATVAV